jgi:hypothetical protein
VLFRSGGLESWDPITEPTKIQAGIYTAPGSFILLEDYNGSPIDDISSGSRGDIIYFFPNNNRWAVISAEDKNKGVYQTFLQLQTAYPTAQNGDYALVTATSTFYAWFDDQWNNTGTNVAPDALRSTNNLSDLVDFLVARTNLDVYSKSETNTQISNGVFSNVNIATTADIETSKLKQTTITPNVNTPANNDTQDVLNTQCAIANRLFVDLIRGNLYSELVQVEGTPSLEPFVDRFENKIAGWTLTFDVNIPQNMTIC